MRSTCYQLWSWNRSTDRAFFCVHFCLYFVHSPLSPVKLKKKKISFHCFFNHSYYSYRFLHSKFNSKMVINVRQIFRVGETYTALEDIYEKLAEHYEVVHFGNQTKSKCVFLWSRNISRHISVYRKRTYILLIRKIEKIIIEV